jgi:MOSC domain-containing protein
MTSPRFGDDSRMSASAGRVAWIAIAPVKSMALVHLERAHLGIAGIAGDRAFALIDENDRLVNGKRLGRLALIKPDYDAAAGRLELRFPDGETIAADVELGEAVDAWFFGHPRPARIVVGPWTSAISDRVGRQLRIVAPDGPGDGLDRGPTATLLSTAALASLALAGGEDEPLDHRRFRMTFGIDGVAAHAEDGWLGRDVRVGGAVVRPAGNVGRCAVTTHDPDTGVASFDTLGTLEATRGRLDTTEPLPFGVWADVVQPGNIRVGDPVVPE